MRGHDIDDTDVIGQISDIHVAFAAQCAIGIAAIAVYSLRYR